MRVDVDNVNNFFFLISEWLTSTWCDLRCINEGSGCVGTEGKCDGVCYCLKVSVEKRYIYNQPGVTGYVSVCM